jgi:hypothetical protein
MILGVNRRTYPSQQGSAVSVLVVLVAGEVGDYAAYAGCGDSEWVARHGDKISFEEACQHFPYLERERYRL